MYDAIDEGMLEFAMTVQSFVKEGWEFKDISYGERRLGTRSSVVMEKDGKKYRCWCEDDMFRAAQGERKPDK
jgi:hypothetical protein